MIKVYKTDVTEDSLAEDILNEIRNILPGSDPSFDLEDCDNVLRIEHNSGKIIEKDIRKILARHGYSMEMLPY